MFVLGALPILAHARSQGVKFSRAPLVVESKNSQTMALLEGHLNSTPVPASSPKLAIIDNSALSAQGDQGEIFTEAGKSGTGQISVYIVRKGDTLPAIAKMFGVTTNTIMWANDLKNSTIKEGQELVILPISGVKHTVKSGDTLQSIAKKYNADLNDILAFNDVAVSDKLVPGDVIIVPDGEIAAPASSGSVKPTGSNYPSVAGYFMRPISGGHKTQGIHGHNGVDLGAPVGTPIMASATGKVIISRSGGYNGGYGTYVVISHANGTQTLYAHMSTNKVVVGQTVTQGQVIGAVGMTGKTSGAHLHFEVRGAKNPF
ncbi:MAG: M23 family metallopeptidase [Patescibacteria group bacterium]